MVRLVKGAYWDTEVKRAQERGLADYPVFTRKAMTDLCYVACTRKLLAARARLYPQFATHNALTVASVIEDAGGVEGYEFQRLHGMGEVLYELAARRLSAGGCGSMRRSAAIAICWPIWCAGCWRTAPIPRSCRSRPIRRCRSPSILKRPQNWIGDPQHARHPKIPLPRDLYAPERRNSAGVEFGDRASLDALLAEIRDGTMPDAGRAARSTAACAPGAARVVHSPIDGKAIGRVSEARRRRRRGRDGGGAGRLCRLGGDAGRGARRRARARERSPRSARAAA